MTDNSKLAKKRVYIDRPLDELPADTVREIADIIAAQIEAYTDEAGVLNPPPLEGVEIPLTPELFPERPLKDASALPMVAGLTKQ